MGVLPSAAREELGTTYTDEGPRGTLYGRVTAFDPPNGIRFEQPMKIEIGPLRGRIGIDVRYTLSPLSDGRTNVVRDVSLSFEGIAAPFDGLLLPQFEKENARVIACLKARLEAGP